MSSRDRALMSTHHVVLECQPITLFLRQRPSKMFLTAALLLTAEASLGNACGADCEAAAAFGKEEISILLLFLSFSLLFDLLSIVSSDVG